TRMLEADRNVLRLDEQPIILPRSPTEVELDHDPTPVNTIESNAPAHPPQQHNGIQLVRARVTEGPACSPFSKQIDDALQFSSGRGEAILGRLSARTGTPFQQARSFKPTQPLRQKRPRHPRKAALQLVETTDVRKELAD